MFSVGFNLGYKGHLSRVTPSSKIKQMSSSCLCSIQNDLSNAGVQFNEKFADWCVGFMETMDIQKEI